MGLAPLELVAIGVVHRMTAGPAVIGNQQQAVQHKAHHTLDPSIGVEALWPHSWARTQQPMATVPVPSP